MRVFFLLVEYHSSAKVFPTIKLKNIKASATCNEKRVRLSLKPWGIALKFLFLHHENILFPND